MEVEWSQVLELTERQSEAQPEHAQYQVFSKLSLFFLLFDQIVALRQSKRLSIPKLLKLKGVGYMEHKIVFDYLVKKNHILSQNVWKERLRFISIIRNRDEFESKTLKRKALNVWDRYRIWRICLFFYRIISEIYMFVKTIWQFLQQVGGMKQT